MKEHTFLIQRLNKPLEPNKQVLEFFSFGGGYKNGGLSDDAMTLLRPIFHFDYMGSAEFEFGALPKTLSHMLQNIKDYGTSEFKINGKKLFVICKTAEKQEVHDVIKRVAKGTHHLKESSHLDWALGLEKHPRNRECDTIGWLELNNHFIFFIDENAFKQFASLFNLLEEPSESTTDTAPTQ